LKRLLSLCTLGLLLSASLLACNTNGNPNGSFAPTPARPTNSGPQPGSTNPAMVTELTQIITAYYTDIEAKNYTQAYIYLDPQATNSMDGTTITRSSFIQLAQSMDSEEGPVVSFDIGVFPPATQITMTVMRSSHQGPYHAHLDMKQENNTWKISSLDRI
jgi:hypothetical protein